MSLFGPAFTVCPRSRPPAGSTLVAQATVTPGTPRLLPQTTMTPTPICCGSGTREATGFGLPQRRVGHEGLEVAVPGPHASLRREHLIASPRFRQAPPV